MATRIPEELFEHIIENVLTTDSKYAMSRIGQLLGLRFANGRTLFRLLASIPTLGDLILHDLTFDSQPTRTDFTSPYLWRLNYIMSNNLLVMHFLPLLVASNSYGRHSRPTPTHQRRTRATRLLDSDDYHTLLQLLRILEGSASVEDWAVRRAKSLRIVEMVKQQADPELIYLSICLYDEGDSDIYTRLVPRVLVRFTPEEPSTSEHEPTAIHIKELCIDFLTSLAPAAQDTLAEHMWARFAETALRLRHLCGVLLVRPFTTRDAAFGISDRGFQPLIAAHKLCTHWYNEGSIVVEGIGRTQRAPEGTLGQAALRCSGLVAQTNWRYTEGNLHPIWDGEKLFQHVVWHACVYGFALLPQHEAKAAISPISRVCQYWARLSRRDLFSSLDLHSAAEFRQLQVFLAAPILVGLEPIADLIFSIRVFVNGTGRPWLHLAASAAEAMCNCDNFTVLIHAATDFPLACPHILQAALPRAIPGMNVSKLVLDGLCFADGHALFRLLASVPSLDTLDLHKVSFSTQPGLGDFFAPPYGWRLRTVLSDGLLALLFLPLLASSHVCGYIVPTGRRRRDPLYFLDAEDYLTLLHLASTPEGSSSTSEQKMPPFRCQLRVCCIYGQSKHTYFEFSLLERHTGLLLSPAVLVHILPEFDALVSSTCESTAMHVDMMHIDLTQDLAAATVHTFVEHTWASFAETALRLLHLRAVQLIRPAVMPDYALGIKYQRSVYRKGIGLDADKPDMTCLVFSLVERHTGVPLSPVMLVHLMPDVSDLPAGGPMAMHVVMVQIDLFQKLVPAAVSTLVEQTWARFAETALRLPHLLTVQLIRPAVMSDTALGISDRVFAPLISEGKLCTHWIACKMSRLEIVEERVNGTQRASGRTLGEATGRCSALLAQTCWRYTEGTLCPGQDAEKLFQHVVWHACASGLTLLSQHEAKTAHSCIGRVCRYWARLSRQFLFHSLDLRSAADFQQLQLFLAAPTLAGLEPITDLIFHIRMFVNGTGRPWLHLAAPAAQAMHNCSGFIVVACATADSPLASPHILQAALPRAVPGASISGLMLNGLRFRDGHALFRLLVSVPSLGELDIQNISFDTQPATSEFLAFPYRGRLHNIKSDSLLALHLLPLLVSSHESRHSRNNRRRHRLSACINNNSDYFTILHLLSILESSPSAPSCAALPAQCQPSIRCVDLQFSANEPEHLYFTFSHLERHTKRQLSPAVFVRLMIDTPHSSVCEPTGMHVGTVCIMLSQEFSPATVHTLVEHTWSRFAETALRLPNLCAVLLIRPAAMPDTALGISDRAFGPLISAGKMNALWIEGQYGEFVAQRVNGTQRTPGLPDQEREGGRSDIASAAEGSQGAAR
ncbi:hypothetical protein PsYK624_152680 [Phanerochaete sordida]|uniref:Uncharacterized protein n=1 Tax=Phanerochaete sordida TaxID=48140 RepID=A0A9P3GSZ9_9APHY|nr:hypothetical protein PsYK624_152680 [Phanerochaete sordida]